MSAENTKPIQVSVLVTTYKHEEYIAECLDSIISQKTGFAIEVLVGVDDGGDRTLEICNEYQEKFPGLVKVFLNDPENVLTVNGRRVGRYNFLNVYNRARGKYIARCDGDDYWTDENKLQIQYDLMEAHPEAIACHHWHKYAYPDENGKYNEIDAPREGQGYYPNETATVKEIFENKLRIKLRTVFFRRIDAPLPDWFNKVTYGDVSLMIFLGKYGCFLFQNKVMAVYRQTGKGASKLGKGSDDFVLKQNIGWIRLWEFGNRYHQFKYNKEVNKTIKFFIKDIFVRNGNKESAFKGLKDYFKTQSTGTFLYKLRMRRIVYTLYKTSK